MKEQSVAKVTGKECPICKFSLSLTTDGDCEHFRCTSCGVLRTNYNYEGSQYGDSYANNYLEYAKSPINQSLNLFRLGLISRWLKEGDSVLDVGCCVGEFLRFAEHYYECYGFEPNKTAATFARARTHDSIIEEEFKDFATHLNCITLFDVIEHIQEPEIFVKFLRTLLIPRGILVMTTPNIDAVLPYTPKTIKSWKHYKPKEHLFIHSQNSLEIIMKNSDFEIIHWGYEESDIRPDNPNSDIMTCVARRIS